jgi:DNA-directed RNA polymerase subunit beta
VFKKFFSKYKEPIISLSNLAEVQLNSFEWIVAEGLNELFREFFPIKDYSEKEFILEFLGFSLEEPKFDEYYCRQNNLSLDAPLKIKVRLTNKKLEQTKEQEVFLADMPMMTKHGTFIVNGIERVIVSQLARSFGVYFSLNILRGKKYFGAKIIPSRGAWIEIETESDGAIYARIDRKRKIPVTSLLRVFGADNDKEIEKYFSEIDKGEIPYIKKTFEKDPSKSVEDSFIEIYKRLRPGELATFENAKEYLTGIFNSVRYDLSLVGRYRLNYRLGLPVDDIKNSPKIISLSDLMAIIAKIIELNNTPGAQADDIDHLGTRRVRGIGELLQNRLRVGMARMRRNIQDRMSTLGSSVSLLPSQLINNRPFMSVLKEFFATNQLSQFMNQQNILSELEHLRRLTATGPGGLTRERAGFEVRDVHSSHYGRICPIETPEGPNIGLVVHLSAYARLNEFGIMETPYVKVKNGIITKEVVYMNALEESKYNIAHAGIKYDLDGKIIDELVEARVNSQPGLVSKMEINFIDVAPWQAFSIATSLIPFLEHDDATRALMGSNMQRQATPVVRPEIPLVSTGIEHRAARDSGRLLICEGDGIVENVDANHIIVKEKNGKRKTYKFVNFMRSNDFTVIHQRPIVNLKDKVTKGMVMADGSSSAQGELALGQNVLVAFMSWGGANFEDAIIISERLVKEDKFSSLHIEDFSVNVRDTKLGPELNTCDIPNVGEDKLKDLDEEGIIRIGAEVRANDILVGKISPKGEVELTSEERLLRSIFGEKSRDVKDTSRRLDHGKQGRVIGVKIFSREKGDKLEPGIIKQITVEVAQLRSVSVGDKLSGRHGNKGVISRILPEEDLPHLEDGTPVDIILNPLGVAGRMNLGQVLETHLGWAANKLNYQAITPPFLGATEKEIKEELKKSGLNEDGKVRLYDGRTGEVFEDNVTVGYIYMMKLGHMVEDKIHMRSIGPYSLITQQPLGGKAQGGGQRFGEMEVWALEGYGAAFTLQEMLTVKSDDIVGRVNTYDSIIRGEPMKSPNLPASFHVLVHELKGLALDVEIKGIIKQN